MGQDKQAKLSHIEQITKFVQGKCVVCGLPGHNDCMPGNVWTEKKTREMIQSGELDTDLLTKVSRMIKPLRKDPPAPPAPSPMPIPKFVKVTIPNEHKRTVERPKPILKEVQDMPDIRRLTKDSAGTEFRIFETRADRPDIMRATCNLWKRAHWSSLCRRCGCRYALSKDVREWSNYKTTHCRKCRELFKKESVEFLEAFSGELISKKTKPEDFAFLPPDDYKAVSSLETAREVDMETQVAAPPTTKPDAVDEFLDNKCNIVPPEFAGNHNIKKQEAIPGKVSWWMSVCRFCGNSYRLSHNKKSWTKCNTNYCTEHRDSKFSGTQDPIRTAGKEAALQLKKLQFENFFKDASNEVVAATSHYVIQALVESASNDGKVSPQTLQDFDNRIRQWREEWLDKLDRSL